MRITQHLTISAGLLTLLAGCGDSRPVAPLTNNAFIGRPQPAASAPTTAPAPLIAQASPAPETPNMAPGILPEERYTPTPPVNPEAIPVMIAPGQYQTVGGVVSEVNGNPIYAGKVLRALRAELSARALEMDQAQFSRFAAEQIRERIRFFQRDELLFAAADRALTTEERRLAEMLTMQYRTRRVTESGGSIELARRKAAADGEDFDEQVYDQFRRFMTDVYYRRKVFPRIQITANDLRSYYTQNVEREFTERAEVKFRLIKVDPRLRGGADRAKALADDLRNKALAGDFAEVARANNDDARLARAGGEEAPIQRGAYRLEKVEAALWTIPVGELTPVIEDTGGFYIAKVEERKDGRITPFDDRGVQEKIRQTLWQRQFRQMADEIEQRLRKNSMVRESPEMTQTVIEMAMQGYAIWSKRS